MREATSLLLVSVLVLPATTGCLSSLDGIGEPGVPAPIALTRSQPFPDLVVEVDYAGDYEPTEEALDTLERELRNVTDKRSITVTSPSSIPAVSEEHGTEELLETHRQHLDTTDNESAVIHVVYVNGEFEDNPAALGLGFSWNRVSPVFLYADRIENLYVSDLPSPLTDALPNPAPEKVERSVLVHEAGHALGLVNLTTPMLEDREDEDNPGHSANEDSVMYYAAATERAVLEHLQDNEHLPYQFDEDDRADLRAIREGQTEPIDRRGAPEPAVPGEGLNPGPLH